MSSPLRRLWCWLKNHRWESLVDHRICTRCWTEWDDDQGVTL